MINRMPLIKILSLIAAGLSLTFTAIWTLETGSAAVAPEAAPQAQATSGGAYLLRFDPTITQFQVITLPASFDQPHQLAVVANSTNRDVWFTDLTADKIGRLTYTDTNDFEVTAYDLPANSEPFDLLVQSGFVWFTARKGNYIGRLTISSGLTATFPLPTPDSLPLNLSLGSDGSFWFVEQGAGQLGRLVVTDTNDSALTEYPIPAVYTQPQGLTLVNQSGLDQVWFSVRDITAPNFHRIIQFDPSQPPPDDFKSTGPLSNPSNPVNLDSRGNDIWFTELWGNNISLVFFSTFGFADRVPVPTANSQPYDLTIAPNGDIWFSERTGRKLGQLVEGMSGAQITEFAIPQSLSSAWLQGVALDDQDRVWLTAFVPASVYLPLVLRQE